MKKFLPLALLLWASLALAQSYPSPTFQNTTVLGTLTAATPSFTNPVPVTSGGTGSSTASGAGLDNISGFSGTGFLTRTGAGAYAFQGLTNGITLGNLAQGAANTVLANATGSTANFTAVAMPSCSASSSALQWTSGTGFGCGSFVPSASPTFTGTASFANISTTGTTAFGVDPTIGAATFFPAVPTNSALKALSTVTTSTVTRLGFYAAGDAPPLVYIASASACSLNAGAGDNGSQVQSANGKCWIPAIPMAVADVREWGAVPDGVTDDTTEIQAAINSGIRSIYVPSGTYLITNTLNITNLASSGVPLKIYGDEVQYNHGATNAGTIILCRTAGSNSGWIADLTGTEFTTIQDIYFLASGTNASTKGLLYARSTVSNFAQNNTLRRVIINLPSASTATAVGSVAVANNTSEEFVIDESWLQADTPLLSTLDNDASLTSPYATIATTTFSNTKYSVRDTTLEPILYSGIIAYGLASANFDNVTIIPVTPYTYPYAITLRSSTVGYQNNYNIRITGQVESFATVLRLEGNTENINVAVSTSNVNGNNVSLVAGTTHQNLRYTPSPLNNANQNAVLSTGPSVTLYGGEITLPNTMTLVDPNLILSGTSIDGENNDLSNASVFSVNSSSSYRPRWSGDYTHYSATVNPGSIATGSTYGTSFAAANVRLTDKIEFSAPYDLQGCVAIANVLSSGNIRLSIINLTGSPVTLASGTWRFWVERPTF